MGHFNPSPSSGCGGNRKGRREVTLPASARHEGFCETDKRPLNTGDQYQRPLLEAENPERVPLCGSCVRKARSGGLIPVASARRRGRALLRRWRSSEAHDET